MYNIGPNRYDIIVLCVIAFVSLALLITLPLWVAGIGAAVFIISSAIGILIRNKEATNIFAIIGVIYCVLGVASYLLNLI